MADRPKGYGMTAELNAKKDAKYDASLANEAFAWINEVFEHAGQPASLPGDPDQDTVTESLKNGQILCELINIIAPGSVKKVNTSKMAFKMMENIGNFLSGCEALGIVKTDIFQTVDLYEGQNIPQVINGLHALGRKCQTVNPDLPVLGPKEADKNKREFTDEQLQAGKGVIGLQMGSNKGASQAGATPYGLGRQIEKTNLKT